jgi:hypothetical protein
MDVSCDNVFSDLLEHNNVQCKWRSEGSLVEVEELLRPAIGKPRYNGRNKFGAVGTAVHHDYVSFNTTQTVSPPLSMALSDIVAPDFSSGDRIRSGRYYARGGPTKLCLREDPISHCVGTSLGGAPLYAVPLSTVRKRKEREAFLEYANWHREQDGLLVMRLRPDRAVALFGPYTESLQMAVSNWQRGDTRKYKLVGNMVAPICAKAIADVVSVGMAESIGGHAGGK